MGIVLDRLTRKLGLLQSASRDSAQRKRLFLPSLELLTQLHKQPTQNVHSEEPSAVLRFCPPEVVLPRLFDDRPMPCLEQQRRKRRPVLCKLDPQTPTHDLNANFFPIRACALSIPLAFHFSCHWASLIEDQCLNIWSIGKSARLIERFRRCNRNAVYLKREIRRHIGETPKLAARYPKDDGATSIVNACLRFQSHQLVFR
jgi:hypothetical protein